MPTTPNTPSQENGSELQLPQANERLRQLEEQLKARDGAFAKLEADYAVLHRFVMKHLKEEALRTVPEIPNDDLEAYGEAHGAVPLEDFIDDLERLCAGQQQ